MSEEVVMAGGKVSSSKVPAIHLIPTDALIGLADRFAVGTARKGDKAWNATTSNHDVLENREFLIERVSHIIRHALLLRDQIVAGRFGSADGAGNGGTDGDEDSFYENAGAVAFGGALMLCAARWNRPKLKVKREKKSEDIVDVEAW